MVSLRNSYIVIFCVKERLVQMQTHMARPPLKLQEVDSRWNSTHQMLRRIYDLREPVGAAVASLLTDIPPLTAGEYMIVGECLSILSPFNDATVELSEEKRVSASKVIPLLKMLNHALAEEIPNKTTLMGQQLADSLTNLLRDKLHQLQSMSISTLPTLLDPRFKTLGFLSQTKATEAVKRLTSECAFIISKHTPPPPQPATTASQAEGPSTSSGMFFMLYTGLILIYYIK